MDTVSIEMECDDFNDMLEAIEYGAEWMNENGYSGDCKKYKIIYNKLKELCEKS